MLGNPCTVTVLRKNRRKKYGVYDGFGFCHVLHLKGLPEPNPPIEAGDKLFLKSYTIDPHTERVLVGSYTHVPKERDADV